VRIGALARRCGISRSTLLYYDRIGLLRPSDRSESNYRQYTDADVARLEQIRLYRQTGMTLGDIARLLRAPRGEMARSLHVQLGRVAERIESLRDQQRLIVRLLGKPRLLEDVSPMNRARWTALLRAAGFDDEALHRWHRNFERTAPREHQQFLEFLSIPDRDIARIRAWSRTGR
jgi:DNA-binding transcriptional MerR regulator